VNVVQAVGGLWFQIATSDRFIEAVERVVGRKVFSFSSSSDPERGVVVEIFVFEPDPS